MVQKIHPEIEFDGGASKNSSGNAGSAPTLCQQKQGKKPSGGAKHKKIKRSWGTLVWGDKDDVSTRFVITRSGRMKMLHRDCSLTPEDWEGLSVRDASKASDQNVLELVCQSGKAVPLATPRSTSQEEDIQTVIEFDTVEEIADEGDGSLEVPVRRVGCLEGRLECHWKIANVNMVERLFEELDPKEGMAVFEDGEAYTTITVPIIDDPTWNVETVYNVFLDPHSNLGSHACLGANSSMAVYSLNNNAFPSNVPSSAPMAQMIWGFLHHNYMEIPKETISGCLISCFPALHYYISAQVMKGLIDCGVSKDKEQCIFFGVEIQADIEMRQLVISILAIIQLALFLLKWICSWRMRRLRLGGKATRMLRTNMFSTMLQLCNKAKESYDDGDVPKALDTQVDMAIKSVWLPAFALVDSALQLVVKTAITFQIAAVSPDLTTLVRVSIYLTSPVMVLMVGLMVKLRAGRQFAMFHDALIADDNWSAFVTMAESCSPLILNYGQGVISAETFNFAHSRFNKAAARADDYSKDSIHILQGGFAGVFALMVIIGGNAVLHGGLTIGGFVVLINAVKNFGQTLVGVGKIINTMVTGTAAVRKLADILNKRTRRRERLKRAEEGGPGWKTSNSGCSDIQLKQISYDYPGVVSGKAAVSTLNLTIKSGQLVCLPPAAQVDDINDKWPGTNTLFRLISRELIPTGGTMMFPGRWKVIYVPVVPILFDGTLMYNLAYSQYSPKREDVWAVCQALGLCENLLWKDNFDVSSHGTALRFSDRLIVSLTRALLHGVDVLLISSAMDVLGEDHGGKVLRYLQRYTHNRGLPDDNAHVATDPLHLRHIKTVIYTSKFASLRDMAESIIAAG